jgi:hypothetical protein
MARVNPRKLPWTRRPEILERVKKTYELYQQGYQFVEIAAELKVDYTTTWRDMRRARELAEAEAAVGVLNVREDAVGQRRHTQRAAFEDRDAADGNDASGRAGLLRVVGDNQDRVEELYDLRRKDAAPQTSVTLIQMGGGPAKQIEDMTDDELKLLEERLSGDGHGE